MLAYILIHAAKSQYLSSIASNFYSMKLYQRDRFNILEKHLNIGDTLNISEMDINIARNASTRVDERHDIWLRLQFRRKVKNIAALA